MKLRRVYRATPEAVARARKAASAHARALGADDSTLEAIALAVSEAVTNIVIHAYRKQQTAGEAVLEVEPAPRGSGIVVRVVDNGCGMAPRVDSPGLGLGIPLIGHMADDLRVLTPIEGGTVMSMQFGLA